ncbi:undecaprenyldiphospho-muramoylpentapeptide beta-N-acetylglucosaminyltransferase [Sporichthya polymorpha]|uniref:undecaprenyldiphospho-muramoylpentapeptide beta-N-acetylglucosaminyltransferase n=1 Tax=Sporichthya polymorpha TaxID=35751 RepID=UPI00036DE99F|nr:undecaprenyldiphospho-muramoylpentapeptide beta-N-acetylglucosaminyltransferase [Sporichthya polymorpha]
MPPKDSAGVPAGAAGLSVVVAGGGTAGHIEPAMNLADALRRRNPDITVTALGTPTGMENTLVPARGYELRHVPRVPLPRRPNLDLMRLPATLRGAVRAAGRALDDVGADVVVGFGGYVSVPAYLAARKRKLPIVVHEANARPGVANRLGARLTPFVAVTARADDLRGARLLGIPLRRTISTLDRGAARAEARKHFGLEEDRPTLLVFGGSLGARRLNEAATGAAAALRAAGIQVLHSVGREHAESISVPAEPGRAPYVVVPYLERMDLAYAAADVALCRAGAMTCAELAAVGLPAVYVPLPIGNGEQRLNALPVVEAGGGIVVEDSTVSAAWISENVVPLMGDPARMTAMGAAAAAHGRRDADEALVDLVLEAVASRAAGAEHRGADDRGADDRGADDRSVGEK